MEVGETRKVEPNKEFLVFPKLPPLRRVVGLLLYNKF